MVVGVLRPPRMDRRTCEAGPVTSSLRMRPRWPGSLGVSDAASRARRRSRRTMAGSTSSRICLRHGWFGPGFRGLRMRTRRSRRRDGKRSSPDRRHLTTIRNPGYTSAARCRATIRMRRPGSRRERCQRSWTGPRRRLGHRTKREPRPWRSPSCASLERPSQPWVLQEAASKLWRYRNRGLAQSAWFHCLQWAPAPGLGPVKKAASNP